MILADAGSAFQDAATSGPLLLALGACALAGLVSFASPCVIPLVPGYLSIWRRWWALTTDRRTEPELNLIGCASPGRRCCSWRGSPRYSCWAPLR